MKKVIVGMSGGVDSSVTAHLLKQQGYEVEGVSFQLWDARTRSHTTACCAEEASLSAAQTAELIDIRHRSVDVRVPFIETVIEPFADAYARGTTPNPCILCNRFVKFPFLLREAERSGADHIATGHYARVERAGAGSGRFILKKGIDPKKDQSYVLFVLTQDVLSRLLLPLGGLTKDRVREIARSLGLPAADRPESQEICFVEDDDYAAFLERLHPGQAAEGPIRDLDGNLLGTHRGLFRYTIGQRKGLGISRPEPLYVVALDTAANTLIVGPQEAAFMKSFRVTGINWIVVPEAERFSAGVKVRSTMQERPALVECREREALVTFEEPQWAPAPGQSAVFYEGDTVLGGGVLSRLS